MRSGIWVSAFWTAPAKRSARRRFFRAAAVARRIESSVANTAKLSKESGVALRFPPRSKKKSTPSLVRATFENAAIYHGCAQRRPTKLLTTKLSEETVV